MTTSAPIDPATPHTGIAVDASCVEGEGTKARDGYFHGKVEWRGVDLSTGQEVFRSHVQERSTVNIGEFCAIVAGLKYLAERGDTSSPVYSDSKICVAWAAKRKTASKLPVDALTRPALVDLVEALAWLCEQEPENPVVWWRKNLWGDMPADFGRKQPKSFYWKKAMENR